MFQTLRVLSRSVPRSYLFALQRQNRPSNVLFTAQSSYLAKGAPPFPAAHYSSKSDSTPPLKRSIDQDEASTTQRKLKANTGEGSTGDSNSIRLESSRSSIGSGENLSGGLKHDIDIVKDTFRLDRVPRESHILGLFGTVPYLATSVSTVFLAWDLTKQLPTGNSFYDMVFVNHETAKYLLGIIEPLQLGYGAVIISFLGAIHWGLEYAEKKPLRERTRFRYGMGLAASVIAWPTLYMPIEYALTTQFMAFVGLYFADARATTRGWAPEWYAQYRFLLTTMVGLAIFISLVGRAEIGQQGRLSSQGLGERMSKPGIVDNVTNWAKIEAEEIKKQKEEEAAKAEAEAKKGKSKKVNKKKDGDKKTKEDESQDQDKKKQGKDEKSSSSGQKNESEAQKDSKDEQDPSTEEEKKPQADDGGEEDDKNSNGSDEDSSEDSEDEQGEKKQGDEKKEEKQSEDKQSEKKKGDDKQGDDKQGDDKQGDDKQDDEKKDKKDKS